MGSMFLTDAVVLTQERLWVVFYSRLIKPPVYFRTSSKDERKALETGLRSSSAFVLRRCQVLLNSSRGERPPRQPETSAALRKPCERTYTFDGRGLGASTPGSVRTSGSPRRPRLVEGRGLRELVHKKRFVYSKIVSPKTSPPQSPSPATDCSCPWQNKPG
jgi:hypothetical protein